MTHTYEWRPISPNWDSADICNGLVFVGLSFAVSAGIIVTENMWPLLAYFLMIVFESRTAWQRSHNSPPTDTQKQGE